MRYTNRSCFIGGIVIFVLLLLAGCRGAADAPPPELSATVVAITHTPPSARSPTIVASATATAEPTATATPLPASTLTPLPTLPADEAEKLVMSLLRDNAGCQLPCWWGITPGEASLDIASQFLSSFALKVYTADVLPVEKDGVVYLRAGVSVNYKLSGQFSDGSTYLTSINGVVDVIGVRPRGTELNYQLHHLLTTHGQPESVLFEADTDYSLFHLLLYYPDQGITALYESKFERLSATYRVCPQGVGPELWLWSPGNVFTLTDDQFIGPDIIRLMRPLTDVTSLDLETWYQTYQDPGAPCFETPRHIWETP
jgi:hypothetical protein